MRVSSLSPEIEKGRKEKEVENEIGKMKYAQAARTFAKNKLEKEQQKRGMGEREV